MTDIKEVDTPKLQNREDLLDHVGTSVSEFFENLAKDAATPGLEELSPLQRAETIVEELKRLVDNPETEAKLASRIEKLQTEA